MYLSASAMLLSACASSQTASGPDCLPTAEAPAASGVSTAPPTVTVIARDDYFDPACIDARSDAEVTLVVRNDGRHPHNLTLENGDSVSVDSAQVAFITARAGTDGLTYVCTIHPGMGGRIRISE